MTISWSLKAIDLALRKLFIVTGVLSSIFFWLNILWDYRLRAALFWSGGQMFYFYISLVKYKSMEGRRSCFIDIERVIRKREFNSS